MEKENSRKVFISCFDESSKDGDRAVAIEEHFKKQDIDVQLDSGLTLEERENHISNSRWTIIILSPEAVKSNKFLWLCSQLLMHCINNNIVKVLPVLTDLPVGDVPYLFRWLSLMDASASNFYEKLSGVIRGNLGNR